tara:strand:- start:134 stop:445 length:312 start_codon:yes stop_codon:yes gene_type:complete
MKPSEHTATVKVKILINLKDGWGNKSTLGVTSDGFGTLRYNLWGSWTDSGIPYALSNLGTKGRQPVSIDDYDDIEKLEAAILCWLDSGYKDAVAVRFAKAIPV